MGMHRLLPTEALTPTNTPPVGASNTDIIRFAQTLNGYDVCGDRKSLERTIERMPYLRACTVHQLRLRLFLTQRQHYHQGGSWGPEDPVMESMREICTLIRERVLDQKSALLPWTGDITRLDVDAIVNATRPSLLGGGGVDGAIHRAAGPKLRQACEQLPETSPGIRCPTGEARITPGFDLPASEIIHTVGPRWSGGATGEDALLAQTYSRCVKLAHERRLQSLAFPAISTGAYGFPAKRAERIATETVHRLLGQLPHTLRVLFVTFSGEGSVPK